MIAMVQQDVTPRPTLVVGLGATGMAVARFLVGRGMVIAVVDSRAAPPAAEQLRSEMPEVACYCGDFDVAQLVAAERLVVSPGVDPHHPAIQAARDAGVEVIGDIELFARYATAPVIAITGSNGKSTVTTLVGEMARSAGIKVAVGGNLGTPAVALIADPEPELYVLELSSFQLEMTHSLRPISSVVLNLSEDHLDRHHTMAHYAAIKQRIYTPAGVAVINLDDPLVTEMGSGLDRRINYSLQKSAAAGALGITTHGGERWFAYGEQLLMPCSTLRLAGKHNESNTLAAMALLLGAVGSIDVPIDAMQRALQQFQGLPHRCLLVAEHQGICWYDDSKGTNVGATLAAIEGLPHQRMVLIAGGLGKGADFTPLGRVVVERARGVVLIGEDAPLIEQAIAAAQGAHVAVQRAQSMTQAVEMAAMLAQSGDGVLLSPACASFDMFANYVARGNAFVAAVEQLLEGADG